MLCIRGEEIAIDDEQVPRRFGELLKQRREYLDFSQAEVSRKIGMKASQYCGLEKGRQKAINLVQLQRLGRVLHVSIDALLELTEQSPHLR